MLKRQRIKLQGEHHTRKQHWECMLYLLCVAMLDFYSKTTIILESLRDFLWIEHKGQMMSHAKAKLD